MKKIPILFLTILTLGLALTPTSSASAMIEDRGTTWWEVSELLDFYYEVEAEKTAQCHGDPDCNMDFHFSRLETDDKYRAMSSFTDAQVWVTAVNPQAETIKLLFFDQDMMLKQMGIEEYLSLEHLYLGWFEEWSGQIFNYNHEQFTNGSIAGLHTMYDASAETDGENWLPAWQEVEISVAGSDLINNTSGLIAYAAYAGPFNAQGSFGYLSCLRDANYTEGSECKMMVSGDKGISYFPPRQANEPETTGSTETLEPETPDPALDPTNQDNSTASDSPTTQSESNNSTISDGPKNAYSASHYPENSPVSRAENRESTALARSTESLAQGTTPTSSTQDIAPSDGLLDLTALKTIDDATSPTPLSASTVELPKSGNCEKETIFPWWFIILVAACDILIMWLFWPKNSIKNS